MQLNQNIYTQSDNRFAQYLIYFGNGIESYIEDDFINLSKEIVIACNDTETLELHLINAVFTGITKNSASSHYMTQHGILSAKNKFVDYLNGKLIGLLSEAIDDTN